MKHRRGLKRGSGVSQREEARRVSDLMLSSLYRNALQREWELLSFPMRVDVGKDVRKISMKWYPYIEWGELPLDHEMREAWEAWV